ncbi:MAG: GAP family protein [Solirubrobacterales bacterium]|nr:GAP family protein [Solirubrobacterales bacterium]
MSEVFALAVVSALDAGLLTAAVVLLGRPRPARQLGSYLIGGMGFSIIFGLLIVFALHGSNLLSERVQSIIEVVAGALLLVVAVAVGSGRALQWHPRRTGKRQADHPRRQSLQDRALGNDSLWIAWAAGAVYSAPGAYYLVGLALLARLNAAVSTNVLAILAFNVIQFALIEIPLLALLMAPDRARPLTEKLNRWMTAHRRILIVIIAGAVGAYLLISGIPDLT